VDQAAADVEGEKPQSPQDDQDDDDCLKHANLLYFFRLSRLCPLPPSDGKAGLAEANHLVAVFMPESFPLLRMSGKLISSLEKNGIPGDRRFEASGWIDRAAFLTWKPFCSTVRFLFGRIF
jgi:hypothetical protein